MRRCARSIMLSALLATMLAWPAGAQINPFKGSSFELSKEDVALLKGAAAKLYLGETAPLGTIETWSNPESGNSGTIELVKIFEHQGMPCRRLRHEIALSDTADTYRYVVDRCRVPSGVWKVL